MRSGTPPIGSRRRRVALNTNSNIPFEELPYQCFQEARKVLLQDRDEKLGQIATQRARIERLRHASVDGEHAASFQAKRLGSMRRQLERLKIMADINDPLVKKRYEDGLGDMSRPIYRHYAERKWRSQRHLILKQRIEQMHVIPDVLPSLDMTVDMHMVFGRKTVHPGDKVPSRVSEQAPKIIIQPFDDQGERLVTIAVVDPDVPNAATDSFDARTHFLACNIAISPTQPTVRLDRRYAQPGDDDAIKQELIQDWIPPTAQKGAPYHRLCVVVMEQPGKAVIDVDEARTQQMHKRSVREMMSTWKLKPTGAYLFRTQWDDGTDSLMRKLGVQGSEVQFKRKRVEPLPYKRKPSDGERYR